MPIDQKILNLLNYLANQNDTGLNKIDNNKFKLEHKYLNQSISVFQLTGEASSIAIMEINENWVNLILTYRTFGRENIFNHKQIDFETFYVSLTGQACLYIKELNKKKFFKKFDRLISAKSVCEVNSIANGTYEI